MSAAPAAKVVQPLRIAIMNDYELIVRGVADILAPFPGRVEVVELDLQRSPVDNVDIVLYDSFTSPGADDPEVAKLAEDLGDVRLVIYSWNLQADLISAARSNGVAGYLSKGLPATELVAALERIHAGEWVQPPIEETAAAAGRDAEDAQPRVTTTLWPGREEGLTQREAEVVALITQGLSNQEIARRTYLSINSVKSYIRLAYRKMGVESRSQAVLWGVRHGLMQDGPERKSE